MTIDHPKGAAPSTGAPFPWLLAYFRQIYSHKVDTTPDGVTLVRLAPEEVRIEALHLAYSFDGRRWTALNDNRPTLPAATAEEAIRDPFLGRGPDGWFHLLATRGWATRDIYYNRSRDLIHWEQPRSLPVTDGLPRARNAWAPEWVWDQEQGNYFVFWSTSFGKTGWDDSRIWCSRSEDFHTFSVPRLLFDPGFTVIDATIVPFDGTFYLFFKDERFGHLHGEHRYIQVATAPRLDGPYTIATGAITPSITEGPAVMQGQDERWYLFYDYCMDNCYGVSVSADLLSWQALGDIDFPPSTRHGSILSITEDELAVLRRHFEAGRAGGSAVLPVAQVVEIVREWVDLHARHLPDFAGAYLWGGITALPPDAPFPLYRDVDVRVVVTEGAQDDTLEILYRGVMLEIGWKNLAAHHDAEAVLADPSHGPNMATTQILADPTGILAPLQQAVAADFGRRRWIQARCEAEKVSAEQQLAAVRQVSNPTVGQELLWPVWGLLNALSGLLAVAQLERPTTRRTLSLLGDLLDEHRRSDLHEAALVVWGSAHMSRADVEAMLDQSLAAFDRSVEVYQTPTPFGFTIQAHLRPYLDEATQAMIDEGNHREATFWIMTLVTESYLVLQNDAPDAEKPMFAAQLQAMLAALGYTSAEAWAARVDAAERLAQEIYRIADALVARHPD